MTKNWPMWLGLMLGLAAIAIGFAVGGSLEQDWSAATRYTARVGFPLLILAYVARPLAQLTRWDMAKALLARRKYFGLGFAMSHTVHLAAIVMLFRTLGEIPEAITIIGGGFAYVLLYAMAFTSNQRAMKALGRRWKTLHRIGIHYLWFIFAQSYIGRIFRPETMVEGLVSSAIVLSAAAIRFAAWRKSTRSRAATAAG